MRSWSSGCDVGKEGVGIRKDGMGGGQGDGESFHLINGFTHWLLFTTPLCFGKVASGAAEGMMWRAAPAEVAQVHAAIAELAALDRPETGAEPIEHTIKGRGKQKNKKQKSVEGEESKGGPEVGGKGDAGGDGVDAEEQHVLDDFFASRTIRRLVQDSAAPPVESGALPFAAVLWERALKGRCHLWAETHRWGLAWDGCLSECLNVCMVWEETERKLPRDWCL